MIVSGGVRAAAAREPGRTALVAGASRLSFGELDRAIDAAGSGFRALGLERGARLAIGLPNCAEYLIAFFAAARSGMVAVTIPSGAGATDLAAALAQARPQAVLGTAAWLAAHWEVLRAHAPGARCIAVADGSDPRGEARPARDGVVPWHAVVEAAGAPPPPAVPGDLFYIGYTSGSTGRPIRGGAPARGVGGPARLPTIC